MCGNQEQEFAFHLDMLNAYLGDFMMLQFMFSSEFEPPVTTEEGHV